MTTLTLIYQREYRARVGRDRTRDRINAHLASYRGKQHPRPCRVCTHQCPGPRCMTTLHDPYQLLCGYCRRVLPESPVTAKMSGVGVSGKPDRITRGAVSELTPLAPRRSSSGVRR